MLPDSRFGGGLWSPKHALLSPSLDTQHTASATWNGPRPAPRHALPHRISLTQLLRPHSGFTVPVVMQGTFPAAIALPLPLLTAPWKPSVPIPLQSNCLRPQPRAVTMAGSPGRPPRQGGGRSGPRRAASDKGVNQGMKETFTSPSRRDQGGRDTRLPACHKEWRGKRINADSKIATRLISFSKSVLNKKNGEKRWGQTGSNEVLGVGGENQLRINRLENTGAGSDGSPGQGTRRPEATVFTQHHTSVLKGKADKVTRKFLKFSPENPREWTLPKSKRTEPLQ